MIPTRYQICWKKKRINKPQTTEKKGLVFSLRMIGVNQNILSSNLLGDKAGGAIISSSLRDLPVVWETHLPPTALSDLSESIEINRGKSSSVSTSSASSADQSVWSTLFSWLSYDSSSSSAGAGNRCEIAIPHQEQHKAFMAMKRNSDVLICRSIDNFLSSQALEFLVLSKIKLKGEALSFAWANDQSPIGLIGTTSGLTIVRLPSPSTAENVPMDHANVEVRALTCVHFPVSSVATSPLGRLAVISSGSEVYLLDVWQNQISPVLSSTSFSSVMIEKVVWSNCNDKVFVHYRDNQVIVLETYSWKYRTYSLAIDSDSLSTGDEGVGKHSWVHGYQALFLNTDNSIFRANPDTENPKSRSLTCDDIGFSNGLTATRNKAIHDYSLSDNGRFLAVAYRDLQSNELDETVEIFECKDAEFSSFKRISSIKRSANGNGQKPVNFQFAKCPLASNGKNKKRNDISQMDIYIDKGDEESKKLMLFPPVEIRRQVSKTLDNDRYFLWIVWSDNNLVSYLVN